MNRKTIAPQLNVLLRLFLATLSLGIVIWLIHELNSGAIHWSIADYISSETIDLYVAKSTTAKVAGSLLFGLLATGFMAYAIRPRIVHKLPVVLPWLATLIILGLLMTPLSERVGP